jgi:hypothetical protein
MGKIELKFDDGIAAPVRSVYRAGESFRSILRGLPNGASVLVETLKIVNNFRAAGRKVGKHVVSEKRTVGLHGEDGFRVWFFDKETNQN